MHHEACQTKRPPGMRASTRLHKIRIAGPQRDHRGRYAKPLTQKLGERRLVALPGALRPQDHVNAIVGAHENFSALARGAARCLDIVCDCDPAAKPARPR